MIILPRRFVIVCALLLCCLALGQTSVDSAASTNSSSRTATIHVPPPQAATKTRSISSVVPQQLQKTRTRSLSSKPPTAFGPRTATHTIAAAVENSTTTVTATAATNSTVAATNTTTNATTTTILANTTTNATTTSSTTAAAAAESPAAAVLKELVNATSLSGVADLLMLASAATTTTAVGGATAEPDDVVTVRLTVTSVSSVGTFLKNPAANCTTALKASIDTTSTGATISALAGGSALDVKEALLNCVFFNLNPSAAAQNASKILQVQVTVSGASASTASMQLSALPFNPGPQPTLFAKSNCTREVRRGARFEVEFAVFHQHFHLPLEVVASSADGFPLPTSLLISASTSGVVVVRGSTSEAQPIQILFRSTDGYRSSEARCTLVPLYTPLRFVNPPEKPFDVHVGRSFVLPLPLTLFEGSSAFAIVSVLRPGRYPLPAGLTFSPPNSLLGAFPIPLVGVFNFTVTAADDFTEAVGWVTVNVSNQAPQRIASEPFMLAKTPVFAARSMIALEIPLQPLFNDPDDDALNYALGAAELAAVPWLRYSVAPGVFSRAPQILTLSGDVPASARGTNISLLISCTDGTNTTALRTVLEIAMGAAPIQVKELPSFTTEPGAKPISAQLAVSEYFFSPDGDTELLVTFRLVPVTTKWITVSVTPAKDGSAPVVAFSASLDDVVDTSCELWLTVANRLGDNVTSGKPARISFQRSDWQKARQYSTTLGAALGVITSILGIFLYWPHVVNLVRGKSLVTPCPLFWQPREGRFEGEVRGPVFRFPDKTKVFLCMCRTKILVKGVDILRAFDCISHYIYNLLTLRPTPHGRPPIWLLSSEKALKLVLPKPEGDLIEEVNCRFFRAKNFLAQEFTANLNECYEGYGDDDDDHDAGSTSSAAAAAAASSSASASADNGAASTSNKKRKSSNKVVVVASPLIPLDGPDPAELAAMVTDRQKSLEEQARRSSTTMEELTATLAQRESSEKHMELEIRSLKDIIERLVHGSGSGSGVASSCGSLSARSVSGFGQALSEGYTPPALAAPRVIGSGGDGGGTSAANININSNGTDRDSDFALDDDDLSLLLQPATPAPPQRADSRANLRFTQSCLLSPSQSRVLSADLSDEDVL